MARHVILIFAFWHATYIGWLANWCVRAIVTFHNKNQLMLKWAYNRKEIHEQIFRCWIFLWATAMALFISIRRFASEIVESEQTTKEFMVEINISKFRWFFGIWINRATHINFISKIFMISKPTVIFVFKHVS